MSSSPAISRTPARVLVEVNYGWTLFELVSIAAPPVLVFISVLMATESITAWWFMAPALVGSALLWNLARTRKRAASLRVVTDGGVLRLQSGRTAGVTAGSYVTLHKVNRVYVSERVDAGQWIVLVAERLNEAGDDAGTETLRLPSRVFAEKSELTSVVHEVVERCCPPGDRKRLLEVIDG